ncbi:MAG TPA: hypothetical protein ACFYEK_16120 [Candidatus Wunengus sp. YC60]|uniref:hypothetical protein n=1 Tax=Candidatus Wunengus sp. YC60 TaxID=3367697 RepID=UPI00402A4DB6
MIKRQITQITNTRTNLYIPGIEALKGSFQPGDFILTHGDSWMGKLIRFGQKLRFIGDDRRYAWWSHAAIIINIDGDLVEALGTGVQRANLSKYKPREYRIVQIDNFANQDDRMQIVAFANWCLGEPYGVLTILSIALNLLTGSKFTFGIEGQQICSGLVARALERTALIFEFTPSHITPAYLAKKFNIQPTGDVKGLSYLLPGLIIGIIGIFGGIVFFFHGIIKYYNWTPKILSQAANISDAHSGIYLFTIGTFIILITIFIGCLEPKSSRTTKYGYN